MSNSSQNEKMLGPMILLYTFLQKLLEKNITVDILKQSNFGLFL